MYNDFLSWWLQELHAVVLIRCVTPAPISPPFLLAFDVCGSLYACSMEWRQWRRLQLFGNCSIYIAVHATLESNMLRLMQSWQKNGVRDVSKFHAVGMKKRALSQWGRRIYT